jgi:hypothetical protein
VPRTARRRGLTTLACLAHDHRATCNADRAQADRTARRFELTVLGPSIGGHRPGASGITIRTRVLAGLSAAVAGLPLPSPGGQAAWTCVETSRSSTGNAADNLSPLTRSGSDGLRTAGDRARASVGFTLQVGVVRRVCAGPGRALSDSRQVREEVATGRPHIHGVGANLPRLTRAALGRGDLPSDAALRIITAADQDKALEWKYAWRSK